MLFDNHSFRYRTINTHIGLIGSPDIELAILKDAAKKVAYFNRTGVHYEVVYHFVVRKRAETPEIWNDDFIDAITAGLISFDMQRMMGRNKYLVSGEGSWASKLKVALQPFKSGIERLRKFKLQDVDLDDPAIDSSIRNIFDELSMPGKLSIREKQVGFVVGASKILHFLLPDLFVIVDSNSRRELTRYHGFPRGKIDGEMYIKAIRAYQVEPIQWKRLHGDNGYRKLLKIDNSWRTYIGGSYTPIPRIMDKCTFVSERFQVDN